MNKIRSVFFFTVQISSNNKGIIKVADSFGDMWSVSEYAPGRYH